MTTTELLRGSELFCELPPETLDAIAKLCREITLQRGDFLFQIGDASKDLFILKQGAIELGFGTVGSSRPNTGAINQPAEVCGWGALVGETNYRMINAVCVQETRVLAIDGLALMNLLERSSGGFNCLRKLLAIMLNRMVSLAAV